LQIRRIHGGVVWGALVLLQIWAVSAYFEKSEKGVMHSLQKGTVIRAKFDFGVYDPSS